MRRDYRKRDDTRRLVTAGGSSSDFAAVADGSIAAGATGTLFRADSSWAATATAVTALNPSGVTIADGTKCLVGKVRPVSGWVIKQAFTCADSA